MFERIFRILVAIFLIRLILPKNCGLYLKKMILMDYHKLKRKWAGDAHNRIRISHQLKTRLLSDGIPVLKRFGIGKAILFGSVQNGRCDVHSDIDLLVFPLAGNQYWAFRHELEQAMAFSVDVYRQDDDLQFIKKMGERGEVIYEVSS